MTVLAFSGLPKRGISHSDSVNRRIPILARDGRENLAKTSSTICHRRCQEKLRSRRAELALRPPRARKCMDYNRRIDHGANSGHQRRGRHLERTIRHLRSSGSPSA